MLELCTYIHLHSFPTRRSSDLLLRISMTSGDPAQFFPPLCGLAFAGLVLVSLQGLQTVRLARALRAADPAPYLRRSEEHTSELQSQFHIVCRLLLEKKKQQKVT